MMYIKNLGDGVFYITPQAKNDLLNLVPEVNTLIRRRHAELITVDLRGIKVINPSEVAGLMEAKKIVQVKGKQLDILTPDPIPRVMSCVLKSVGIDYKK